MKKPKLHKFDRFLWARRIELLAVNYAIRIPATDSLERDIAELLHRPLLLGRRSHWFLADLSCDRRVCECPGT